MDESIRNVWEISRSRSLFRCPMLMYDRFPTDFKVIIEQVKQMDYKEGPLFVISTPAGPSIDNRGDVVFRCTVCWRKKSPRSGSFFVRSRLTLRQIMWTVVNWIINAVTFANATEASSLQWYEHCRDICAMKMTILHQSFGWIRKVVKIDETVVKKNSNSIEK